MASENKRRHYYRYYFKLFISALFVFLSIYCSYCQEYNLNLYISMQPQTQIILGTLKGDKYSLTDSIFCINGEVRINFQENSPGGIYRFILGQTTYAKVMNEPPQLLDFIFNNENIVFETDFKAPEDSLKIIESEENRVWFEFKQKENEFQQQLKEVEMELDYSRQPPKPLETAKLNETAKWIEAFNQLQRERDNFITQTIEKNQELFATKLIKMYREPFLDGNLTKEERNQIFKKEFLKNLNFTDEALINSSVYTEKAFKYLMSFAQRGLTREQQEQEFMKAVDEILASLQNSEGFTSSETLTKNKVYEFILDYLVRGFEKMNLDNLITYIADKYSGTTCQTDEKTTLERKLEAQKMNIGTVIPDFTLTGLNGEQVTLSEVKKARNLIVFWASWCPHCREMLPQLKEWGKDPSNLETAVFAISIDNSEKNWRSAVVELGTELWFNLSDLQEWNGKTTEDYNVFATPTLFLVDENLRILAKPATISELMNLKP